MAKLLIQVAHQSEFARLKIGHCRREGWAVLALLFAFSPWLVYGQSPAPQPEPRVEIVVLGTAQDAGYPQAGCQKACCAPAWRNPQLRRRVSCVAVVDHITGAKYIFDCTPDFPDQWNWLQTDGARLGSGDGHKPLAHAQDRKAQPDGVFLTHAHIGHYTGLMHLGREVMGAKQAPVYAMPRMKSFLTNNGPWSQLVKLRNIQLVDLQDGVTIKLSERLKVTPIVVPHRDEFSETVGFLIEGPSKKALYLPDIDKWSRWDKRIEDFIARVDVAYLDGTFLSNGELPGRDMSLIPHPFVEESIKRFSALDETNRKKVKFIHLNHTNPALREGGLAEKQILQAGMFVARQGERIEL